MQALRLIGPLVLALVSAVAVDQLTAARGLQPPGFRIGSRRTAGLLFVAAILWVGVFRSLGYIGLPRAPRTDIATPELFLLHALLLISLLGWLLLGFGGVVPARQLPAVLARQLGLVARQPAKEVGIGLGLGLLAWPGLLVVLVVVAAVMFAFGVQDLLPQQPPELVVWIAALPALIKLLVALSAGVVEEIFFRGFLQPRTGIGVSTLLFVLAHLSYDQPFMLVGITLLSLFFGALVQWRQNLWPAIAAHFLFDAAQLLILIPWALEKWPQEGMSTIAAVLHVL